MSTKINNLKTQNWALSTSWFGEIVTGNDEVNQTVGLILSTIKGSDPFRPNFGSDIWDYIDKPLDVAAPNMVRAIIEAVTRWETRIELKSVTYKSQPQYGQPQNIPSGLIFTISWAWVGTDIVEDLVFSISPIEGSLNFIILGSEDGTPVNTEDGNFIGINS